LDFKESSFIIVISCCVQLVYCLDFFCNFMLFLKMSVGYLGIMLIKLVLKSDFLVYIKVQINYVRILNAGVFNFHTL
jgi:hypothetical protein